MKSISNRRGFTLIELLAVIVVLAIIALIAVPIVLNIIEKARKGAAKASAMAYVKAVETYAMETQLDKTMTKLNVGENTVETLNGLIEVKGTKPTSGTVTVDKSWKVTSATLSYEGYSVAYNGKDYSVEGKTTNNGGSSSNEPSTPTVTYGGTKVAAQEGETHKGIVYLDPTDLSKECNATNSVSTTNTKSGCMKWYIYDDSGSNYKMILDHNAIARVRWNAEDTNVAYASSYVKQAMDATLTNWKVTPDLITTSEINAIVGGVSTFDINDRNTWFYFEGTGDKKQTRPTYNANTRNKYAWLYDNTYNCKSDNTDFGCNVEDSNTTYELYGDSSNKGYASGYWTRDTVASAGSGSLVWRVDSYGYLSYNNAYNTTCGVRPVITIEKSKING